MHSASIIASVTNSSFQDISIGFGGYSEGAADDFNKCVWSALYMEPTLSAEEVASQYSAYFFNSPASPLPLSDAGSLLLFGLESNWVGDASENQHVKSTLAIAQSIEATAVANTSWRLQALIYRAYFDACVPKSPHVSVSFLTVKCYSHPFSGMFRQDTSSKNRESRMHTN